MMWEAFLSLLFPRFCLACEGALLQGENTICTSCKVKLPKLKVNNGINNQLASKFYGKIPFRYTFSYLKFTKGSNTQRIIHQLKYNDAKEVGSLLGMWFGHELLEAGFRDVFDLIVPVPLSSKKMKKRGYNQCDGFAESVGACLQSEVNFNTLIRKKDNSSQTRKSRWQRWLNVSEIFALSPGFSVKDKHVLIVDDVLTTGATLEACGHTLLKEGCKSVSFAVIACA